MVVLREKMIGVEKVGRFCGNTSQFGRTKGLGRAKCRLIISRTDVVQQDGLQSFTPTALCPEYLYHDPKHGVPYKPGFQGFHEVSYRVFVCCPNRMLREQRSEPVHRLHVGSYRVSSRRPRVLARVGDGEV